MASCTNAPFRCDIVGSFLRPDVLKRARADFNAGTIDAAQLKTVEDVAIRDLVAKQKAAGLKVVTDGEFRRSYWHLDFMWGLGGIERRTSREGYRFHDEETTADTAVVTGPISGENHPFVKHFKFVQALAGDDHVTRQTIPAPIQTFSEVTLDRCDGQQESLRSVYPNDEALFEAIAAAYRTVIADLYTAGCRNIQFDDCTWGIYCDTDFVAKTGMSPVDIQKVSELGVALNNAAIEGAPADLVITTATTTRPTPLRAATTPSPPACSPTRTCRRSTWSSTRRARAVLSLSSTSPTARRSCWASSRPNSRAWRTRMRSSCASTRPLSTSHWRTSTCRPSAALQAARSATS